MSTQINLDQSPKNVHIEIMNCFRFREPSKCPECNALATCDYFNNVKNLIRGEKEK